MPELFVNAITGA